MKNTVIANRKKGDWEIIKKYFEDRGFSTLGSNGINFEYYYGVIDNEFNVYSLGEVQQANATILEVSDIVSDTVTLPKSFVLEAHKSACSDWKKRIEEVVPELFVKNELEIGRWYKRGMELLVWNGGKSTYGFNMAGGWMDSMCFTKLSVNTEPATEQEVFDALKNESVKRGFKEGVNTKCLSVGNDVSILEDVKMLSFSEGFCRLLFNSNDTAGWTCIFKDGKWASIIEKQIPQELESLISKLGKDKILEYLKD